MGPGPRPSGAGPAVRGGRRPVGPGGGARSRAGLAPYHEPARRGGAAPSPPAGPTSAPSTIRTPAAAGPTGRQMDWNFKRHVQPARLKARNRVRRQPRKLGRSSSPISTPATTPPRHPAGQSRLELQRNFVRATAIPDDATDHTPPGMNADPQSRPRHGDAGSAGRQQARRHLAGLGRLPGLSSAARRSPRSSRSASPTGSCGFTTGTMVQGFDYAPQHGAHVLSMSMGGLSSSALVDAVNLAYDSRLVHGHRRRQQLRRRADAASRSCFPRATAACSRPAASWPTAGPMPACSRHDAGQLRPRRARWRRRSAPIRRTCPGRRSTAARSSTWTAPAPRRRRRRSPRRRPSGWPSTGTRVSAYPEPWMRVEAVRHALFASAAQDRPPQDERGRDAGEDRPGRDAGRRGAGDPAAGAEHVQKLPPAEASWSWLDLLIGGGVSFAAGRADGAGAAGAMLALELTQMAQRVAGGRRGDRRSRTCRPSEIPASRAQPLSRGGARRRQSIAAAAALPRAAPGRQAAAPAPALPQPPPADRAQGQAAAAAGPPAARLRARPERGQERSTPSTVNADRPWRCRGTRRCEPGPVGEYLEVVDVDPASDKVYDPVDLNEK